MDYTKGIRKAGNYIGGEALQPMATATTVRQRNGKTLTTDGPFAETKEQLGGYYLVEAKDLDEAIKLAGGYPRRSATARSRCARSCPRPRSTDTAPRQTTGPSGG